MIYPKTKSDKGTIMAASIIFDGLVKKHTYDEVNPEMGKELVNLFFDTLLMDNCSENVRQAFIAAMKESIEKG